MKLNSAASAIAGISASSTLASISSTFGHPLDPWALAGDGEHLGALFDADDATRRSQGPFDQREVDPGPTTQVENDVAAAKPQPLDRRAAASLAEAHPALIPRCKAGVLD